MPSKQKDKCPSLEELKASTIVVVGILRYVSSIVEYQSLPPIWKKRIENLKDKAAELIMLMRKHIIAEQELLQLQLEEIEKVFKVLVEGI